MSRRKHLSHLINEQQSGKISSSIPQEKLETQALSVAFHNQAVDIANSNMSPEVYAEIAGAVRDFQEGHGGPSMTEKYGDMRVYGGTTTPAKARASNTGIKVTASTSHARPQQKGHGSSAYGLPTPNAITYAQSPQQPGTPGYIEPPQQPGTPGYIAGLRDHCDDTVAFGTDESESQEIVLQQVSDDLSNYDSNTVRLAKRWKDAGKTDKEVVGGLTKIKRTRNNMREH